MSRSISRVRASPACSAEKGRQGSISTWGQGQVRGARHLGTAHQRKRAAQAAGMGKRWRAEMRVCHGPECAGKARRW